MFPITRITVPAISFTVIVSTRIGLEIWTRIIIESGYVPEYQRTTPI